MNGATTTAPSNNLVGPQANTGRLSLQIASGIGASRDPRNFRLLSVSPADVYSSTLTFINAQGVLQPEVYPLTEIDGFWYALLSHVPVGTYTTIAHGYNNLGAEIYTGSTSLTILKNQEAMLCLVMVPTEPGKQEIGNNLPPQFTSYIVSPSVVGYVRNDHPASFLSRAYL